MTIALDNPIVILLSEINTHDIKVSILLKNVNYTKFIANRAYHANRIRHHIQCISSEAFIPCKSKSLNHLPFESHVYKEIHLIENFFSKI
ncbi:IS5/IS1182 family transposase, partial [Francisella tularensis subsp. holarctica]|nr:IS5/IS1182 family transposase [Francisella tularensis subsp. holarctica]